MDFLGDPRNVPYSTLLGSSMDTRSASVYEAFWTTFTHIPREGGLQIDSTRAVWMI